MCSRDTAWPLAEEEDRVVFFGFVSSSFHFLTPPDWLTGGKSVNARCAFVSVCPTATHHNTTQIAH